MTAPANQFTINDLLNLYKPGQLPDLVSILVEGMASLPASRMNTAPATNITALVNDIKTIVTNALKPGVINTTGPNVAEIRRILAKYATPMIPVYMTNYTVPTPPTADSVPPLLAKNNPVFGPVIEYLTTTVNDMLMFVILPIIKDNAGLTDTTKITAIRTLILSFIAFVNNIPDKLKLPGTLLDPNFGEIGIKLSNAITSTLGVVVQPPGSITYQDISSLGTTFPASTNPAIRKTPSSMFIESFNSVKLSLTAIVTSNSVNRYNTPKNIALIKSIPESLKNLASVSSDEFLLKYLVDMSTLIFPVPEPTNSLFTNLNSGNFTASLSQATTGIIPFFCNRVLTDIPNNMMPKLFGWLSARITGRSFQTMDQIYLLVVKVVNVIKGHMAIVNTLINIFQVNISNDVAVQRHVEGLNDILLKSGFQINTKPSASGGRRKKRSVKRRKGKAARRRTRYKRI